MQIPAIFYGQFDDVKAPIRKAFKRFVNGTSWVDAFAGDMLPVETTTGLIMLDGPSPLRRADTDFQLFLPYKYAVEAFVANRISQDMLTTVACSGLESTWCALGAICPSARMLVSRPEWKKPLLVAALAAWPEFESAGARYSTGDQAGRALWGLPTNLPILLGERGVSEALLQEPLPQGGPAALMVS